MSRAAEGIRMDLVAAGRSGHCVVSVYVPAAPPAGSRVVHVAKLDITDRREREGFAEAAAAEVGAAMSLPAERIAEARDGLLARLLAAAADPPGPDRGREAAPSAAARLVALAPRHAELFSAPDGETYATVRIDGHRETHRIRGIGFRRWLHRVCRGSDGSDPGGRTAMPMPTPDAIAGALPELESRADEGPRRPVFLRVGAADGRLYLDLGDPTFRAVEVSADGWRIVADPPVRFRRTPLMGPLPEPSRGGSLEPLRSLLNIPDDRWPLAAAFVLGALRPTGPFPLLLIHGEQGSAKSTNARALRRLVDPNEAPLRGEPRDARDLQIAAANSWLPAFDNLSALTAEMSDALCRLATDGAFSTRTLYANDEETVIRAQRPVILTGIEELAGRSDLLDRAITLHLPPIPPSRRRTEREFWADFERLHAASLGALLDAAAAALANLPAVRLDEPPRMADFALWATAAGPALGWEPGTFSDAFAANGRDADDTAIEATRLRMNASRTGPTGDSWEGTADELRRELDGKLLEREGPDEKGFRKARTARDWPANPRKLAAVLKRIAPNLRRAGLEVTPPTERGRVGKDRDRRYFLSWVVKESRRPSGPSAGAPDPCGATSRRRTVGGGPDRPPPSAPAADGPATADGPAGGRTDSDPGRTASSGDTVRPDALGPQGAGAQADGADGIGPPILREPGDDDPDVVPVFPFVT